MPWRTRRRRVRGERVQVREQLVQAGQLALQRRAERAPDGSLAAAGAADAGRAAALRVAAHAPARRARGGAPQPRRLASLPRAASRALAAGVAATGGGGRVGGALPKRCSRKGLCPASWLIDDDRSGTHAPRRL